MAKTQKQSENVRYAVNKKALKSARARAALEQAQQEERLARREKSRRMSSAFLLGVLGLIGLFCLYTLLRTLLIRRAASLEDLRADLLFVSVAALPFLLGLGAALVHRLLRKRREQYSDRGRRLSNLLFLLALLAAFVLFGVQLRSARADASAHPAYTAVKAALEQSGQTVTAPESVDLSRTLLENSLRADLLCGKTVVRLNDHAERFPGVAARFLDQAAADYEGFPRTEDPAAGLTVWGPAESGESARAAVALRAGAEIRIVELFGPRAELEALLPLLIAGADSATP
ncbi:MAG: hypothetical protein IKI02_06120 [Oscillospiraceae bacterium]|nr:hypothetical protein [Oscillospiraceae bacterium]